MVSFLYMDLKDTYNTIAEDWVKDHDKDTWWQEGTEYFLSLLPKKSTILDVGCGGGIKTRYISEKGYGVMGIDFSDKMIEIAKRENPGIEFAVVDMYDINTIEKTFDGIFVQAALLHIPKNRVMEVLTKMKEKLNPNGLLYLAVKGIRDDGVEEGIKTENDYGYDYQRFFSYFSLDELKNYFTILDLEIVWEGNRGSNATNWIQIIGKKK